jgi:hypothetical protein
LGVNCAYPRRIGVLWCVPWLSTATRLIWTNSDLRLAGRSANRQHEFQFNAIADSGLRHSTAREEKGREDSAPNISSLRTEEGVNYKLMDYALGALVTRYDAKTYTCKHNTGAVIADARNGRTA